jgi:hypothetical protein
VTTFTTETSEAVQRELDRRGIYEPADLADKAPADRTTSRFALAQGPTGLETTPARNVGNCAARLAHSYIQEKADRIVPQPVTVFLQRLAETVDGQVVAVPYARGNPLTGTPTLTPARPGKRISVKDYTPAELLDSFLLGPCPDPSAPGWELPDDQVFAVAAAYANTDPEMRGQALKNLSDALMRLVAARAGLVAGANIIP